MLKHTLVVTYTRTVRIPLTDGEADTFERLDKHVSASIAAEEQGEVSEESVLAECRSFERTIIALSHGAIPEGAQVERTELRRDAQG